MPEKRGGDGLLKETVYLYEDESAAISEAAKRERCSRAEIVRRAVRAYLDLSSGGSGHPRTTPGQR